MQDTMWLKRVLIPFWVIEMLWLLATIVISALGLYAVEEYVSGENEYELHRVVR